MDKLKIILRGNAKLSRFTAHISLPSGFSCPGALACLCKADRTTGRVTDGPHQRFRCFSASQESAFPSVRKSRWHNFDSIVAAGCREEIGKLIIRSLPPKHLWTYMRIHVAGDFFSQDYLDAWLDVARVVTDRTFYFYTKSIPFWAARMEQLGDGHEPGELLNVVPTASLDGRYDDMALSLGLRTAYVVNSPEDAEEKGWLIDHDDSYARERGNDFALLPHGQQPAGSAMSENMRQLRIRDIKYSYSKNDSRSNTRAGIEVASCG